ncbi:hypothetical protein AVEN_214284-1 [Araneus ventricosus]|uniref:Uncharacterized protein n=1 Tax=Araneus ventricosus TaxID=182803 RepID=A0A4Y2KVG2_ARAVE|nr:hypothetical protein AVEN_214284-1 [Araneus ventricosus]
MLYRFSASLVLWLGRGFYRGDYGTTGSLDLGDELLDHVVDKSKIPENAIIFSLSLLEEEIYRMYWMLPCDFTTRRTRRTKRRQPKGGDDSGVSSAVRTGKPVN